MLARAIPAIVLAAALTAPVSASAEGEVVRTVKVSPKACNARTATAADVGEVAYGPEAFAGKCVSLQGFWRDVAVYPTRAEAAQPDALSIPFLDRRRIGLYLTPKDDARAPGQPTPVHVFGVVGSCAKLLASGADVMGYCHYKTGAYLAVASIVVDK
jgi:hypothetical protein